LAAAGLLAAAPGAAQQAQRVNFITASGGQLMDGPTPFRFISFNIPNLNFVEDEFEFTRAHEYRLPDEFELRDAFESVRQMGGTAVRMYTFPVRTQGDPADLPRYVLAPGKFDETSFRTMDLVLKLANEYRVRVIVPLLNNWQWMGGRPQYAAFRGKDKDAFWTDPQLIADFQQTVAYVLNRRNTITGVLYRDDPAILCWETGNELQAPQSWTRTMAQFIKSMDRRHLVMDGAYMTPADVQADLANPDIDILSSHHYERDPNVVIRLLDANRALIQGRKPYLIGEVGFIGTAGMRQIFGAIIDRPDIVGALGWSLRHHRREGGFYWHSEPSQSAERAYESFKAYHVPGFASGDEYDERGFLSMMRAAAFRIRGLAEPAWPLPAAPSALTVDAAGVMSWQGSAGAAAYDVQRAASPAGPWTTVGLGISDADVAYFPLFHDGAALPGHRYYYRVVAYNASGRSAPSAVVSAAIRSQALIDDFTSLFRVYRAAGKLALKSGEDRPFRERLHRVQGEPGAELVYSVPAALESVAVYSFAQGDTAPALSFALSDDGITFSPATVRRTAVATPAGDYGYWTPALYQVDATGSAARFVKIRFERQAQIARVDARYGTASARAAHAGERR
ncbi:MAG TPA: hypothetical protein VF832_20845, partial [Longimicrobiales bacterium]